MGKTMKSCEKEFDKKKLLCSDCKRFFGEEIKAYIAKREKELLQDVLDQISKKWRAIAGKRELEIEDILTIFYKVEEELSNE